MNSSFRQFIIEEKVETRFINQMEYQFMDFMDYRLHVEKEQFRNGLEVIERLMPFEAILM